MYSMFVSKEKTSISKLIYTKDEFKIEPRYAHKKNLNKSEKKHMEGQNWLMKTILQLKSLEKTELFK